MWSVIRCAQSAWNRYLMLTDRTVSFLQVERLQEVRASAAERFRTARPFPHVILDGLFNADLLTGIVNEFPRPTDIEWTSTATGAKSSLRRAVTSTSGL
jgi:hypothetical protein